MKDMPTRILLAEDNSLDVRLLREMLKEQTPHKFALAEVGFMGEAETHLAKNAVDVILLDLGLPDAQGLEAGGGRGPRSRAWYAVGCADRMRRRVNGR